MIANVVVSKKLATCMTKWRIELKALVHAKLYETMFLCNSSTTIILLFEFLQSFLAKRHIARYQYIAFEICSFESVMTTICAQHLPLNCELYSVFAYLRCNQYWT